MTEAANYDLYRLLQKDHSVIGSEQNPVFCRRVREKALYMLLFLSEDHNIF